MDPSVNLEKIAAVTKGYSGADLQAVVYNAHLEGVHDALSRISTSSPSNSLSSSSQKPFVEFVFLKNSDDIRQSRAEAAATATRVCIFINLTEE
jgi:peroxin-1